MSDPAFETGDAPVTARRDAPAMLTRPLRLVLVVIGLAAVVYGTASLTGGWIGTPPWWEVEAGPLPPPHYSTVRTPISATRIHWIDDTYDVEIAGPSDVMTAGAMTAWPRRGREWISSGVVAFGMALVGFAGWPRRSKPS